MQQIEPHTEDPIYWAFVYRMTAVNFRLSAETLGSSLELRDDGTPSTLTAVPFYFLVSHAIELLLKSALLKRGHTLGDLKKLDSRHNLKGMLEKLKEKNLPLSEELIQTIEGFSPQHESHLLRYHFLMNPYMPAPTSLWAILDELLSLTAISTHGR